MRIIQKLLPGNKIAKVVKLFNNLTSHVQGDEAIKMFKEYGAQYPEKTVRLFRATGTSGVFNPSLDGTAEFAGQWFTTDRMKPLRYAEETFKRAKRDGIINPIVLQYVDVPESTLALLKALKLLKGRTDVEYEPTEDYLIPLTFERESVPLTELTGNIFKDRSYFENLLLPDYTNINWRQLMQYVPEARERYGLVGNTNISDEEIAGALYKHVLELGGNTAAVNAQGEPQLLFRGDTQRYTLLKEKMSPEELAEKSGTMDNSLGTLFLGELPGTAEKRTVGLERYLVTGNEFLEKRLKGSGTGSRAVMPDGTFATEWGSTISEFPEGSYHLVTYNTKHGPNTYYKLPSSYSESGVNDINAFVVRTPQVRDASREISVLNDDFFVKGGPKVEYHGPIKKEVLDKDGFPLLVDENGNVMANGLAGSSDRQAMALHYRYVLNDALAKNQGLLKSIGETDGKPGNYLREEHDDYDYFALPNFNIQNAKHILPYDLRIPRDWNDKNIYKGLVPLVGGYTLYNLSNQPELKKLGGQIQKRF